MHLAIALGVEAARRRLQVAFIRGADQVHGLIEARRAHAPASAPALPARCSTDRRRTRLSVLKPGPCRTALPPARRPVRSPLHECHPQPRALRLGPGLRRQEADRGAARPPQPSHTHPLDQRPVPSDSSSDNSQNGGEATPILSTLTTRHSPVNRLLTDELDHLPNDVDSQDQHLVKCCPHLTIGRTITTHGRRVLLPNALANLQRLASELGFAGSSGFEDLASRPLDAGRRSHLSRLRDRSASLQSAYFVGRDPIAYFATVSSGDPPTIAAVQSLVWNDDSAPILFVATDTDLRVYDAWAPPPKADEQVGDDDPRLIALLGASANFLSKLNALSRPKVDSGEFRLAYEQSFQTPGRCLESLLSNLLALHDFLCDPLDSHVALRLVLRAILILQLEHRGIIGPDEYAEFSPDVERFVDLLESHEATYRLFEELDSQLNGDLIRPLEHERDQVTSEDLGRLERFLRGRESLPTGQGTLWPLYDFAVIPISLLSSIYQELLHHIDPDQASGAGVYYTPPALVDAVLDEVLPWPVDGAPTLPSLPSIIDPACGSGVFLVEAFRRLVEYARLSDFPMSPTLCRRILTEHIFGIDTNEEAVDVTAFSLDIAFLDAVTSEEGNTPRFPALRLPRGNNLMVADALETRFTRDFDLVVGNPPWKRVKRTEASRWPFKRWGTVPLQKAAAFVKLAEELAPRGHVALVLPAKWMFNRERPDREFRQTLFRDHDVVYLANLAAFVGGKSKLFRGAHAPASIVVFRPNRQDLDEPVRYWTPLPTRALEPLIRDPQNEWLVAKTDLLSPESPLILKSLFSGGARHTQLMRRLLSTGLSLGSAIRDRGFVSARGLQGQFGTSDEEVVLGLSKHLPARWKGRFRVVADDLQDAPHGSLTRESLRRLFEGPRVLVKKGVVAGRPVAAFIDEPAWFTDNFTAIGGHDDDPLFLKALAAYLNSAVVGYLAIVSASTWGIDRSTINKTELLSFPALPLTNQDTVRQLAALVDRSEGASMESTLSGIDDAVAEAFNLSTVERALISDVLQVRRERLLGEPPVRATPDAVGTYMESLRSVLQPLLRHGRRRLDCNVYVSHASPMGLVELNLSSRTGPGRTRVRQSTDELVDKLASLDAALVASRGSSIYLRRRYMTFSGSTMRLAKAMDAELWTTTGALDDADHLVATLVRTAGTDE